MLFLGQAANYDRKAIWRHFLAFGTKSDYDNLRVALASHYQSEFSRVFLYHNGRSAISAGLKSILSSLDSQSGIKKQKPEVIINSFTCYAVVAAVRAAGCKPVYVDIDTDTLHFSAKNLEKTLKNHPDTVAVIIQNSLGLPVDIVKIQSVIQKYQVALIEDLAHCAGTSYPNQQEAGIIGDITVLSFGKGKSFDTISGGALIFRSKKLHRPRTIPVYRPKIADSMRDRWYPVFGSLIRALYNFGLGRKFTSLLIKLHFIQRSADAELKLSARLTYWQAKLALLQLKNLPKNRPPLRQFYLVEQRDAVLNRLERQGFVFNDTWYDTPVAPERYFQQIDFPSSDCPNAVFVAKHIINFPSHYPKSLLKPALEIIKPYLIEDKNESK